MNTSEINTLFTREDCDLVLDALNEINIRIGLNEELRTLNAAIEKKREDFWNAEYVQYMDELPEYSQGSFE